MKNLFILTVLLSLLFSCTNPVREEALKKQAVKEHKDMQMGVMLDTAQKRIILFGEYPLLDTLKTQIEKLYKEEKIVVGNITIVWEKGFPVWGPYSSHGPGFDTQNLFFGYVVKVSGNTYYVKGDDKKTDYYPYSLN